MNILAINSGSASLKFRLYKMPEEKIFLFGQFKKYSDKQAVLEYSHANKPLLKTKKNVKNWDERINILKGLIKENNLNFNKSVHRVVHGGEKYQKPTLVNKEVLEDIKKLSDLAPLHNPHELKILGQFINAFPDREHYVVFDTEFFAGMPEKAYLYGLPYEYYKKYKIRRYGFHGISHKYVNLELKNKKGEFPRVISCHLGSGSSIAAIKNSKVIDSSMGFSPTENLIMSTRVGEIDYKAAIYLQKKLNINSEKLYRIFNEKSGFLGISQYTGDMKQLLNDYDKKHFAKLAIDMYVYQIQKFIGSYFAALGGLDVLIFTAGIGAGSFKIREMVCRGLSPLGVLIKKEFNRYKIDVENFLDISSSDSKAKVFIIPTNEELQMSREVYGML